MAVSISGSATERVIRMAMVDTDGEKVVKTWGVAGTVVDADLATALDELDALTNAGVTKISVSTSKSASGFGAAVSALQNSVGYIMALTFTQTDPVNAANTIKKSFIVPAPLEALKDTDLKPVTTNSNLNALITFLAANLSFVGSDGVIRAGGWTYNRSMSGFGTVSREIDGL